MHEGHPARQRVAAATLTACGAILVGIGLYFILWRPPLLPEDVRFMGASLPDVEHAVPGLARWLQMVFWVLGGYVVTTGLFTVYLSATALRTGRIPVALLAIAGVTSIGWMALVNFLLDSDSKWPLLVLAVLWASALALVSVAGNSPARRPRPQSPSVHVC